MVISKGSIVYDEEKNEYIVEERIGGGGFSAVFKIKSKQTGEYYALKTFSSDFENETELRSFQNEVSKAMQVKSRNVVEYKFFNNGENFHELPPYIIMEYCNEGTLENYIKKTIESGENISNEEIKNMILQLIDGMADINNKVIHRDIKLKNILLKDGIIKIGDFGISKNILDDTRTITFKGYGSVEYIAPEGWKFEKNTIKMDIYSMGIVFYQIVTLLKYPYNIKKETSDEYREAHLYGSVVSPRKYNPNVELSIESIILKMLEKDPNKRFNNWSEIKGLIDVETQKQNGELLNRILTKRISIDEENRKVEMEKTKKQEEINEKKKIICYSILENIYIPIKDFVEAFNSSYASGEIWISDYEIALERINEIQMRTISNKKMHIIINTIIDEDFKEEYKDPFFEQYYKKSYRPRLNGKEILAWGAVYFEKQMSYNLILVKDEESMYGKWYQIKNRNHALSREPRLPEPFAFDFHEIENEIKLMNAVHIYTSSIEEFNKEELLGNIESII